MRTIIVCALLSAWGCAHSKTAFRNTYCNENGAYTLGQMDANEGVPMRDAIFQKQCKAHDPSIEEMYRQGYSLGIHRHAADDTQLKIVLLAEAQSKEPNDSPLTQKELKTPTTTASLLDDIRSRYGSEPPMCITHQDTTLCGYNCIRDGSLAKCARNATHHCLSDGTRILCGKNCLKQNNTITCDELE